MTRYEERMRRDLKSLPDVDRHIDAELDNLEGCPPHMAKEHRIRLEILRNIRLELQTPELFDLCQP